MVIMKLKNPLKKELNKYKELKRNNLIIKRNGIKVEEVADYYIYPIADNNTPQLSAARFKYNFSSGLVFHRV